nr:ribose-phosphate diphosphokinase [Acidimicrobiia bacterium]
MASMELISKKRFMLVTGSGNDELAQEIADELKVTLGDMSLSTFSNGELYVRYGDSIRGADVFIIQSHCEPINDRIMQQMIMIDAAKRASAKRITAVVPFYGYARQDRKAQGREAITAKLIADMLTVAGVDRVVTVDLHTGQIQGFFDCPVDHLTAVPLLAEYLGEKIKGDVTVVSPDAGGGKRARKFANILEAMSIDTELAFIDKRRPKGTFNESVAEEVVGEVKGRTCILVDDMIDTAGTMCTAAELLKERGATDVYLAATHGVLSGPAIERIGAAPIKECVITNTIPLTDSQKIDNITVLSIAPIIAKALDHVFEDASVSEMFHGENYQ